MSVIERVEMAIRTVREGRCDDAWSKVTPADLEALLKVVRAAQKALDESGWSEIPKKQRGLSCDHATCSGMCALTWAMVAVK